MATSGWRSGATVADVLAEHGGRFGFYQAVRLLARTGRDALTADAPIDPADAVHDAVRFSAGVGDGFAGSEIGSIKFADDSNVVNIKTNGWGIAGPNGPLPQPYGQWLLSNSASGDSSMEAFLNIFNHQLNVLRYLIRSRNYLNLNDLPPEHCRWSGYLAALQGLSEHSFEELAEKELPRAQPLLGFSGLLSDKRVNLPQVCNSLGELLRLPVRMNNFRGEWLQSPAEDRARLCGSKGHKLGATSVLGARVWQQHAGIELVIGPLDWQKFNSLLPLDTPHNEHGELRALALYVTDRRWTIAISLQLKEGKVKPTRLQRQDHSEGTGRLGYNSWLRGKNSAKDQQVTIVIKPE